MEAQDLRQRLMGCDKEISKMLLQIISQGKVRINQKRSNDVVLGQRYKSRTYLNISVFTLIG